VGWASEGITASFAAMVRAERIRALRFGEEVLPIQEKRKRYRLLCTFMEETYLPWAKNEKTPSTYRRELAAYRTWLKPYLGYEFLNEITPAHLEKLKQAMREAGRSPRTIEVTLATLRFALNKAKDWGIFKGDNPVSKVKIPRCDNRRLRFLTPEEAQALLAEVKKRSIQTYEICLLALHCGLRFGEITGLRWADIDLNNGIIYIRDPKNKTNRVAYMTDEVRKMLASKTPGKPYEFVFKDRNGKRIRWVSKAFTRSVEALGLNDGITDPRLKVCFHTLRHTFGSWLVMAGVPIYTVKELMGHKTLAMTERYAHLASEAQRMAVKQLERVARSKGNKIVPLEDIG